jgi:hypothetical protein
MSADPKRDLDPQATSSDESASTRRHSEDAPLQARGPDPRDDLRPEEIPEDGPLAKPAGGAHHDKAPPVLKKQEHKHRALERGRPKDTGRAGA